MKIGVPGALEYQKQLDVPQNSGGARREKQTQTIQNKVALKRYSYSVNEETGGVVVKILDGNTSEVIREIPSKELQELRERLHDGISTFIDLLV